MRVVIVSVIIMMITAAAAFTAPQQLAKKTVPAAAVSSALPAPALPEGMVTLDGKPVFAIKAKVLSFSPIDRAEAISARLARLIKDPLYNSNSVKVIDGETVSDIVTGDTILMSITESDALAEGKPRLLLAEDHATKIRTVIDTRNKEYSLHSILFGALYTLLATIVLVAALMAIKYFLPRTIAKIESWRGIYIRSLHVQSIEIVNEERITAVIISLIRGMKMALLLGLFYLYIPLVLSFFPWTHGMASKLMNYILSPLEKISMAIFSYLPNIFFLLVIIVITRYSIKFIGFLFSEVGKQTIAIPGFYHDWANPTFKIVRFLMIAFAAVVAFPYLPGSDSPAFKGVSVFLGVLFSLGSTSAVSNVVAGVILTYMRAFKLGDRVKIADTVGDVVEQTLLVTRIRTIKNVDITVPNAMVLGSHITNFSSSAHAYGLILHTTVTIGYDAPWRQVHALLIAAAAATENIIELPAPFVLQTSLDDFYVRYELNAYTEKPSVMARTYSELHQNIQEKFNETGVEIMSPHYATLRDGNMTTIPESYLGESYRQPSFRVSKADVT
ncbi:MAG: mechanosensitive ion channel [Desulfuromonadaceae bacterium]|nr:mechanosensitive ion channel [Desulfuromonadaceae bacterium]MDD5105387.1 mechanosensitive ion channel [Desulfuromonadaceae bacterium]